MSCHSAVQRGLSAAATAAPAAVRICLRVAHRWGCNLHDRQLQTQAQPQPELQPAPTSGESTVDAIWTSGQHPLPATLSACAVACPAELCAPEEGAHRHCGVRLHLPAGRARRRTVTSGRRVRDGHVPRGGALGRGGHAAGRVAAQGAQPNVPDAAFIPVCQRALQRGMRSALFMHC